ncbi:hypothetical protein FVE85_9557 [Porphyridium purpureum]|uniref:Uncharacterized protein n=1 Tax=Porphyridium purpureum TaxID=35688 RepID=A0A5J4YJM8_PORPP|nr:hypothetical protein FVE85_9885 [Porphyridium purpureum]KAA8491262.1 hypothetical protein FVE85_9557 [Porphyridium purpureum]|eukprot:POR2171..scf261_15
MGVLHGDEVMCVRDGKQRGACPGLRFALAVCLGIVVVGGYVQEVCSRRMVRWFEPFDARSDTMEESLVEDLDGSTP